MRQTGTLTSWVQKRPQVCGGDACLRDTRYTVWGLVEWRRLGLDDPEILRRHPDLSPEDLEAAWDYFRKNNLEIEQALWLNRADFVVRGRESLAAAVAEGRRLGLQDDAIKEAFDPPLTTAELSAAAP